jgi:hypothetical protein
VKDSKLIAAETGLREDVDDGHLIRAHRGSRCWVLDLGFWG